MSQTHIRLGQMDHAAVGIHAQAMQSMAIRGFVGMDRFDGADYSHGQLTRDTYHEPGERRVEDRKSRKSAG